MSDKKTEETLKQFYLECALDRGIDLNNRVIVLDEDIEEGTFRWVDAALTLMEKESKKTITIKVNSYGGEVYEAMAVVDRIRSSKAFIATEAHGKAMSAALLIFAAGDKRRVGKNAMLMNHGASYRTGHDKHEVIKDYVTQIEKEEQKIYQYLEEQTGEPALFWSNTSKYQDTYFNAEEALQAGLAHEII